MNQVDSLLVEVIDYAINHKLTGCNSPKKRRTNAYSCGAVNNSIDAVLNKYYPNTSWRRRLAIDSAFTPLVAEREEMDRELYLRFNTVIKSLGLDNSKGDAFSKFKNVPEPKRQTARAIWLTFVQQAIKEGTV